jgi:acetyltransferase-like isoleucine patch superfamily enzyme
MTIGTGSVIYGGCEIRMPQKISVGAYSSIGHRCVLDGRSGLTIGSSVNISTEVMIWTLQHDYNDPKFTLEGGEVKVGDYAWLSARSIILPGVSIGRGAVVAAGAVVTKDVAAHTVVGGIPAKKIGERNPDLDYRCNSGIWFA